MSAVRYVTIAEVTISYDASRLKSRWKRYQLLRIQKSSVLPLGSEPARILLVTDKFSTRANCYG
jgi:hypothetical protein